MEELHRQGWLLTPDLYEAIQVETLSSLLEHLDNIQPRELLIRQLKTVGGATPRDMYEAVKVFIDEYRSLIRE